MACAMHATRSTLASEKEGEESSVLYQECAGTESSGQSLIEANDDLYEQGHSGTRARVREMARRARPTGCKDYFVQQEVKVLGKHKYTNKDEGMEDLCSKSTRNVQMDQLKRQKQAYEHENEMEKHKCKTNKRGLLSPGDTCTVPSTGKVTTLDLKCREMTTDLA